MIVASEIKLNEEELERLLHTLDNSYFYFKESLDKKFTPMLRESKRIVKSRLHKGYGVNKGIYIKSLYIKNSSELRKDYFCYQVGARSPHYRLTHLLENGHKVRGCFDRRKSKKGDIPTRKITHIVYGQDYVDKHATNKIVEAVNDAFGKGEQK